MSLDRYIAKQFSDPKGIGGGLISLIMNKQNRPLYEETIRLLSISDTDCVLDIGCGNGYVLKMIARQHNCSLTGIDPSESIIKAASRRCHRFAKSGRMTFMRQAISATSFPDNSFNKAYTVNTVYFWDDLNRAMSEIRRVLKPNGFFINTLYSDETLSRFSHTQFGYKRFSLKQLKSAGTGNGFAVDVVPILNGAAYCILQHRID